MYQTCRYQHERKRENVIEEGMRERVGNQEQQKGTPLLKYKPTKKKININDYPRKNTHEIFKP